MVKAFGYRSNGAADVQEFLEIDMPTPLAADLLVEVRRDLHAHPELSWTELWELTLPGRGFHCTEGTSLEASIQYSLNASEENRSAGARIFRERCTG